MVDVIAKAITDRQRPLRDDLVVAFRAGYLRLSAAESARIVRAARRRFRRHNAGRRWVEGEVWGAMAGTWRDGGVSANEVKQAVRHLPEVRRALERMWPVLTPAELLHDLFGSQALLRLAAEGILDEHEYHALYRPRVEAGEDVRFSAHDVALLDEAREQLGPRLNKQGKVDEADEIRTYGHIVIDEVQDLTPMQLRMAARRSLNGSMTVVGDIAQATGALAPDGWDDVLAHLPDKKPPRIIGLSVGYRIPAQIMELAAKVMHAATPGLRQPSSVRIGDALPSMVRAEGSLGDAVAAEIAALDAALPEGNVAVIVPDALADEIDAALSDAGIPHGRASTTGLDEGITVVPASVMKGLELDGVVVVEPAAIVESEPQGLRALYVALTRSTRRLTVVHARPLPEPLS
jgi:DNA helicase IV